MYSAVIVFAASAKPAQGMQASNSIKQARYSTKETQSYWWIVYLWLCKRAGYPVPNSR